MNKLYKKLTMKRVIKFRAWDGERIWEPDSQIGGLWSFNVFNGNPELKKGWELMQFTGLLDKAGKEIYEGDYYRRYNYLYEVTFSEINTGFRGKCIARLSDFQPQLWIIEAGGKLYELSQDKVTEVIGNIHENPEIKNEKLA
jgi:uncharacterized phage protein (TIGR01671 family)